MHIANVDALKEWLAKTLAPICDADPSTLARYVLALLKKDKSSSELHSVCLQELEVFLQSRTKDFVELLFTTLDDGSYEQGGPKSVTQAASSAATSSGGKLDSQKSRSPERQLSITSKVTARSDALATEPVTRSSVAMATAPVARSDRRESSRTKLTSVRRSRSRDRGMVSQLGSASSRVHRTMSSRDEENHRIQASRIRRSRSRNRSHSRERSRERRVPISHRLGYQGSRDLRRHVDSIRSRNDRHSRDDRLRRRRSRSRSWRGRSRSRSRTRSRSRLRSSPPLRLRSQMRAYSRSRSKTRSKSRSPSLAARDLTSPPAVGSPKRASRSRSSEGRDENAYRIKVPLDVVLSSNPPPPRGQSDAMLDRAGGPSPFPPQVSRLPPPPCPRCRDYDEKGFCLRGNLCPFDHGTDPLIFDDENLPGIVTFPGSQPGPLHASATAPMRQLQPLPPVLLPGPLLAPPSAGVPLIGTGASMIPPLPVAPGRSLLPAGVLVDPKYQPALNSTAVMKGDGTAMPMEASVAVPDHSIIPVLPKDSGEGKRTVVPARRQVNLGVSQSSFPIEDSREATENRDVRLVVRQPGRPLVPISTNDRQLFFPKKHVFDSSRLGIRKAVVSEENSTLELTGVPTHLNTISSINQELSKYGTIVNIQVHYNGQSDHALVSFARNADAAAAFHSSEPVFNNRFVSLSWHSSGRQDSVPEVRKLSVKERLGIRPAPSGVESSSSQLLTNNNGTVREDPEKRLVVLSPSGALTKTLFNKIPPSANNSTSSKVLDNRKTDQPKPMSSLSDLNKEQMKVKLEIAKQKQLLMKKHLEQQKALLVRLENTSLSPDEKKSVLQRMKFLERRLEKMRSELQDGASSLQPLVRSVPAAPTKVHVNHLPPKTFKSRVEMQKSILDAELDLIAKENQGVDTTDLRKSVAVLKSQQVAAQVLAGSRRGLGRGFRGRCIGRGGTFAGRGRGRGTTHLSLATKLIDRRPKQLVVSGFFPSDVDQIIASIAKFTGIESSDVGPGNASVLITFRSRHDAEKAALEGLKFQDRKLLMSWFDARKSGPRLEEKKEEEAIKKDAEEEEAEGEGEGEEEEEAEKEEVALEDSESEVELIVEDDDEKDEEEELSGQVTIDEDEVLDDSELLRLEEDEDSGLLDASWQR